METKDFLGLTLIALGWLVGIGLACASFKLREAAFFLLVAGAILSERLSITFDCQYWYRGSTRGFEYSVLDVLAVSLIVGELLAPRAGQRRWFWPAGLGAILLYFCYCGYSAATCQPHMLGLYELSKIGRGMIIYVAGALYVRSDRDLGVLVLALAGAVGFEGLFTFKQHFSGVYRVPGTLDHSNSLSMYLCMAGPVLVAATTSSLPRFIRRCAAVAVVLAAVEVLMTLSRAGIPIFALVTLGAAARCGSWRITPQKVLVTMVGSLALIGLVYKAWDNLKARFEQASFQQEYEDKNSEGRGYYLRLAQAIVADHFCGVGLNTWSYWVSKEYGPKLGFHYDDYDNIEMAPEKELLPSINYAAPAHNLEALTVGELGWPGLALFGLIWLRWFQMGVTFLWRRPRNMVQRMGAGIFFATMGIFLQSLFEWVYRQTPIFFTCHLLLGTLASLRYIQHQANFPAPAAEAGAATEELLDEPAAVEG